MTFIVVKFKSRQYAKNIIISQHEYDIIQYGSCTFCAELSALGWHYAFQSLLSRVLFHSTCFLSVSLHQISPSVTCLPGLRKTPHTFPIL